MAPPPNPSFINQCIYFIYKDDCPLMLSSRLEEFPDFLDSGPNINPIEFATAPIKKGALHLARHRPGRHRFPNPSRPHQQNPPGSPNPRRLVLLGAVHHVDDLPNLFPTLVHSNQIFQSLLHLPFWLLASVKNLKFKIQISLKVNIKASEEHQVEIISVISKFVHFQKFFLEIFFLKFKI